MCIRDSNGADQMVFQTEKMLKENGDKLPADVKSDAEAKLADLRTAVQSGNVDDIKAKQEALSQVFEKMYQAAAAAQQAAGAQPCLLYTSCWARIWNRRSPGCAS